MSCSSCRPNRLARVLWLGLLATVLVAFAYLDGHGQTFEPSALEGSRP